MEKDMKRIGFKSFVFAALAASLAGLMGCKFKAADAAA
jgi:hypothetical protein